MTIKIKRGVTTRSTDKLDAKIRFKMDYFFAFLFLAIISTSFSNRSERILQPHVRLERDTLTIPVKTLTLFDPSVCNINPTYPTKFRNDSLNKSFKSRIVFREVYLSLFKFQQGCLKAKYLAFIGFAGNKITIGFDLNHDKKFQTAEISVMPAKSKRVVTYMLAPHDICTDSDLIDSIPLHMIPFVNGATNRDKSLSDTMLRLSMSRGFVKEYSLPTGAILRTYAGSILKTDSALIDKYILSEKGHLRALYPSEDLLKVDSNFYEFVPSFTFDNLKLSQTTATASGKKLQKLALETIDSLSLLSLETGSKKNLKRSSKYILLDFWATWCKPCIASMPKLRALDRKYKKDLQFVSICIDKSENATKARTIVSMNHLVNEQLFVNYSTTVIEALERFYVTVFPTYLLIDDQDRVLKIVNNLEDIDFEGLVH